MSSPQSWTHLPAQSRLAARYNPMAYKAASMLLSFVPSTNPPSGENQYQFGIHKDFMSPRQNKPRNPSKAASIYDVARESGVSVFTVSAVVNNKTQVGEK